MAAPPMVEDQGWWENLHDEQIEQARLLETLWHSRGITLVLLTRHHPPAAPRRTAQLTAGSLTIPAHKDPQGNPSAPGEHW